MVDFARELITVNLEDEMRQSYLDYAMSVIVGRALPDVRDGMKPVHRRVIHAMNESGNYWNKSYVKSARIVGDVMGSYHPHGDTAIYDTIVRMAQPFSMRYMLVDGQGNFGSVDGDAPAAMRYTEVRMAKFAHQLVIDIDKDTIDFIPNYDGSTKEPIVFPTRIPNLLVNGASGIAVGMATNIPPHNLGEVINAVTALIDNPALTIDEIMAYIPGPDFPTAGVINGASGIKEAYKTGRGRIYIRAVSHIETDDKNGKQSIVFTELPYQVNKANLQKKIHELVKEKKIEGITETRDESDKDGMRLVLDLRRGEVAEVILNNLYKQTQLQNVFGINMVALVDGRPRLLNLKEILEAFVKHRREIVTRRTLFELRKDRSRAHILEGLAIALSNIDEIVKLIRASATPAIAKQSLMARQWEPGVVKSLLVNKEESALSRPEELDDEFGLVTDNSYQLTEVQAQSILDLRLHRLTGLEKDKIIDEYKEIIERIKYYLDILGNPETLLGVIKDELNEVKANLSDDRRTQILENHLNLTLEDLITEEEVIVTLSHAGYIKTQSVDEYQTQRRGGRGKSATKVKDEDFVEKMFVANTHDTILCFSNSGKLYWLKVYDLPVATRVSRGRPIVNMLPLEADEKIEAILPIKSFDTEHYVFMATRFGVVKKTSLADFSRPRSSGIIALNIRDGDRLLDAVLTDGKNDIMLVTDAGKAMRFNEENVRAMGRTAAGVRGIKVNDDNEVVSVCVLSPDLEQSVLLASQNGFGKRTLSVDFPTKNRGGQGVIALKTSERNGKVVGAAVVAAEDEVMLITSNGVLVRTSINGISCQGRNTQGVTLIKLDKGEKLQQVERLQILDDEDDLEDDHPDEDTINPDDTTETTE